MQTKPGSKQFWNPLRHYPTEAQEREMKSKARPQPHNAKINYQCPPRQICTLYTNPNNKTPFCRLSVVKIFPFSVDQTKKQTRGGSLTRHTRHTRHTSLQGKEPSPPSSQNLIGRAHCKALILRWNPNSLFS